MTSSINNEQEWPANEATEETGDMAVESPPLTISRRELLEGGSDRKFREMVNDLLAFGARHQAIRNGHAAFVGLPGAQYTTLITIRHLESEQPATVGLVAKRLHVSSTFVTMETKKLQQAGLITKTRDRQDSRVVNLSVTEAGHNLLAMLSPVQRKINDQEFAELTREEFYELHRLIRRLVTTCDRAIALQRYIYANDKGEAGGQVRGSRSNES